MIQLTDIESMHELREMHNNPEIVIEKGVWIEIVNFDPHTEQAEVFKRWHVDGVNKTVEGDVTKYKIICTKLDIKKDNDMKKDIAYAVLNKHNELLKASFAKCLIEGIETRIVPDLKAMLYKLGGMINDKQKDSQ